MRLIAFTLALASSGVFAQDVAVVFGKPVTAAELKWQPGEPPAQAAKQLRERVLTDAFSRFVTANRLQATPEDLAAYSRWEAEFRRVDLKRRADRLEELERELKAPNLEARKREQFAKERDVLLQLRKYDAERPAPQAAGTAQAWWIEGYKAKKALYEKYGGRVGITKWGPDPVGATEALLQEHEKRGDFAIADAVLAKEFWDALAREPRFLAKPEQIDFTYYWLKPVK